MRYRFVPNRRFEFKECTVNGMESTLLNWSLVLSVRMFGTQLCSPVYTLSINRSIRPWFGFHSFFMIILCQFAHPENLSRDTIKEKWPRPGAPHALDTSLNTSLNSALDPLVLNPCRRSQLFRVAWATAPIRCGRPRILQGGGVRLFIYENEGEGGGWGWGGRGGGSFIGVKERKKDLTRLFLQIWWT